MQTKEKIFKLVAGAFVGIGIVALSGCMSTPDRSAGRVLDDKMIANKVKSALNNTPVYKFDDVKVATYKGIVQLSGFVDTDDQKRKAEDVAKRVDWVRDVVNNISIKPHDEIPTPTGHATGERTTSSSSDATTRSTYSTPSSTITTNNSSIRSTDRSTNP
jgi:hypothetical protein